MPVVGILNQKGGSGKTTISINLARALQLGGQKVVLVDSDPQGSARDWHAAGNGEFLSVVGLDRPTLNKDIKAISREFDWILIDGAPQLTNLAVAAIKCSDLILIPAQPSPYDIWAAEELVDLIKERQQVTDGNPKAAFIISRKISKTNLGKEVKEALIGYGLPIFNAGTTQRVVYAETASIGSTVLDKDINSEASAEVKAIAEELKAFAQQKIRMELVV